MRTAIPRLALSVVALALVLGTVPVARAQTWTEVGDAGSFVSTAQVTVGSSGLTAIDGFLASPEDVDVYCIQVSMMPRVPDLPVIRLACTVNMGPNVWLFDANGIGISTNGTCTGGYKTLTTSTVAPNGTYYVAVSYHGVDPYSTPGPIWLPALPGERLPDGPGAAGPLNSWAGTPTVQGPNPYTLTFSYTAPCEAAVSTTNGTWGRLKLLYRD